MGFLEFRIRISLGFVGNLVDIKLVIQEEFGQIVERQDELVQVLSKSRQRGVCLNRTVGETVVSHIDQAGGVFIGSLGEHLFLGE